MKKCPYCAKEYPDEATTCLIDGESLPVNNPQPLSPTGQTVDTAPSDKHAPYLTFPDYQWSARDAWKCAGMIIVLGIIYWSFIAALDWHFSVFRSWRFSGVGTFLVSMAFYSVEVLAAAYFARTERLAAFWKGFGLDRQPSKYVWFGVIMAFAIRFLGHFIYSHGWSRGVTDYDFDAFRKTIGFERYFFLLPLIILAPIFEETINRGFIYKAFRGTYPITVSMVLIVVWAAYRHWAYYSHSWIAAVDLSILTIVQCYLREKSDSLWDCIFCHFAFNASLLFVSALK